MSLLSLWSSGNLSLHFWPDPIRNRNKRFGSGFESVFEFGSETGWALFSGRNKVGFILLYKFHILQVVVRSVVDPRHFGMDPGPRIRASYLWIRIRILQIYCAPCSYLVWRWGWEKILVQKKKFWPVSDLDPNPGFGSFRISNTASLGNQD